MKRPQRFLLVLLLLLAGIGFYIPQYRPPLAQDLIRLHVIANSNYFYDQELKRCVKDRIVSLTAPEFSQARNPQEARDMSRQLASQIEQAAQAEIRRQGYDYPVQVVQGNYSFPAKTYTVPNASSQGESRTLPAGRYEAIRVIIGEGRGNNWWCVLYPPLCFVSPGSALPPVTTPAAAVDTKQTDAPPQNAADAADTADAEKKRPALEYRFKIVELIKSWSRHQKTAA